MKFKFGYVMVLGLPNAGKSTLMNRLLDTKVSIVTHKAQTTRSTITGVLNTPSMQAIMLDTPGYQNRRDKLNKMIRESFKAIVPYTDVALVVVDPITMKHVSSYEANNAYREGESNYGRGRKHSSVEPFLQLAQVVNDMPVPTIVALNKWDKYSKELFYESATTMSKYMKYDEILPISALSGKSGNNMETLSGLIEKFLPEGQKAYHEEIVSTNNEGFLASEFVREKVFRYTNNEVPYDTAVITTSTSETNTVIKFEMDIVVKTKSQKGIIIGKNGQMLRTIGEEARLELEKLLGKKLFLELYVRVNEQWDRDVTSISGLN